MKTPEWDFFKRLEKLEPKIEELEPEVATAIKVGAVSLLLLFMYMVVQRPGNARKIKDLVVSTLKSAGLRRDDVEVFERLFLKACDMIEEER